MTLNMGPQHPSTHGVLRFVVKADGEVMRQAIPDVGYLHRSIEKISEKVGWHGFMPYTDRVDYVAAMFCNQGWGMVSERLGDIAVPKRGEYCRVDRRRAQPHRQPSAVGRHDGARHRRDHALLPRLPRAREDQRPARGAVRRAAHLQLHAHRRRRLGPAARLPGEGHGVPRSLRADARGVPRPHLGEQNLRRALRRRGGDQPGGGGELQPGRSQPARLRRALRRAPRRALLGLSGARVRRAGRRRRARRARRQLRAVRDPHPRDEGERQDPAPVLQADAGRGR